VPHRGEVSAKGGAAEIIERAEMGQHRFQHGITPDAQLLANDLYLRVPIAEMPCEPRERGCIGRGDFDQRLRLAVCLRDRKAFRGRLPAGLILSGVMCVIIARLRHPRAIGRTCRFDR
jgi:hypothetical protein